jgi:hypothetical protein
VFLNMLWYCGHQMFASRFYINLFSFWYIQSLDISFRSSTLVGLPQLQLCCARESPMYKTWRAEIKQADKCFPSSEQVCHFLQPEYDTDVLYFGLIAAKSQRIFNL